MKERVSKRETKRNEKTRKKRQGTRRQGSSLFRQFENEITQIFFEILLTVKLYHWRTFHYSEHKATDELYGKINEHMDRFMEVLLGKSSVRMDFVKKLSLNSVTTKEQMERKIAGFKEYLVHLSDKKAMKTMSNVDLYTIRDELLADLNQFLYLLTLE
jgi:DNA-binding ferritin-like protein